MAYFPMYIELEKQKCLVVGGGVVAYRKVQVLRDFGASVIVIAPQIDPRIEELNDVEKKKRPFQESDLEGMCLVVAATDNEEENHKIAVCCRKNRIPVNAVDQIEDCQFIFSSYVKRGPVVASFSSGGNSPVVTQRLKQKMAEVMTDEIGEMAEFLGGLREYVKANVETEKKRKKVYEELLDWGLTNHRIPDEKMIHEVIGRLK